MRINFHYPRIYWRVVEITSLDSGYIDGKNNVRRHIGFRFDTEFSINLYPNKAGYMTLSFLGFGFELDF